MPTGLPVEYNHETDGPIGYFSEDEQGRSLTYMGWFHPRFVNPDVVAMVIAAPICDWTYRRAEGTVTQEFKEHPLAREKGWVGKRRVWKLTGQFDRRGYQLGVWPD